MIHFFKIYTFAVLVLGGVLFAETPCTPHAGVPYPEEGSGACTGNILLAIPLPTLGLELNYNTTASTGDFGYGTAAWRLSLDSRLKDMSGSYFLTQNANAVLVETGSGSQKQFQGNSTSGWSSANLAISRSSLKYANGQIIEEAKDHSQVIYSASTPDNVHIIWSSTGAIGANPYSSLGIQRNAKGQILKITYPYTKYVAFSVVNNRTESIEDMAHSLYALGYDSLGRLSSVKYPDGTGWSIEYSGSSNLVSKISNTWGESTEFAYQNTDGVIQSLLTQKGYRTNYSYTADTVTVQNQVDKLVETFNENHALVKSEENGMVSEFVVNAAKLPVLTTYPLGNSSVFEYDARLNLLSFQEEDGNITTYKYDERDNLTEMKRGPIVTKYTYDADNRLKTVLTNGHTYTLERDGFFITDIKDGAKTIAHMGYYRGLITSITDKAGYTQSFGYLNGLLSSFVDSLGRETKFQRNALGLPTQTNLPGGLSELASYDSLGRVTESKIQNGSGKSLGMKISRTSPRLAYNGKVPKKVKLAGYGDFSGPATTRTVTRTLDGADKETQTEADGKTSVNGRDVANCKGCSDVQDAVPPPVKQCFEGCIFTLSPTGAIDPATGDIATEYICCRFTDEIGLIRPWVSSSQLENFSDCGNPPEVDQTCKNFLSGK